MNLRDNIISHVLNTKKHHIILEAGTGVGKSRVALEKLNQLYKPASKILIVVPRKVLIQNWKDEFCKWHYEGTLLDVIFVTYVSLPKAAGKWDVVIYDEAHHLSQRCRESLKNFHIKNAIYLSATLGRDVRDFIFSQYGGSDVEVISVTTKKAIENNILPDPKVILLPLELDDTTPSCTYFPKKQWRKLKHINTVSYKDRWQVRKTGKPYAFECTQRQYYNELSGLIEWYKRKSYSQLMRNLWLSACGDRLKWLSFNKLSLIKSLISKIRGRYVVFCNTIEESVLLNIPQVNSKAGTLNLMRFNNRKIDSIAAVNCLNEGVNLVDCGIGIFQAINSSPTYQIQKIGRELRHKSPVLIIPFYKDTREEEIVNKWMSNFNKDNISYVKNIKEIDV